MKAIVQDGKTGRLAVENLPMPSPPDGFVRVRTAVSLVSAGTERAILAEARESLVRKAGKKPHLVSQVMQSLKKEGVAHTAVKLKAKLAQLHGRRTLGYSSAGTVIESRARGGAVCAGDRVACGGSGYAVHAEYVIVPENLCVRIPDGLSFEKAAFATVGAVAMQGVRRADAQVGECFGVIGLGLLGMLTCDILTAAGLRAFGIDTDEEKVAAARALGHTAFLRDDPHLEDRMMRFTDGRLLDGVITTASSPSNDPALLSCRILRKRGRNVIVGDYKLDFDRETLFSKELDIRMSTSYGPGRYDREFEEKGRTYPHEYVRWTETENMKSVLALIAAGSIRVEEMVAHRFNIDDAADAYTLIARGGAGGRSAVLISYPEEGREPASTIFLGKTGREQKGIGFIGAGRFAQSFLLPQLKTAGVVLKGVANLNPVSARAVAEKFGFEWAAANPGEIIDHDEIDTVFIATRHNLHGELLLKALEKGKCVFLEKPLCIRPDELKEIRAFLSETSRPPVFTVGFNRRFAPASRWIMERIRAADKIVIHHTINAGRLPEGFWLLDPDIGGGRLAGEFCHFIDHAIFFLGRIDSVEAQGFMGHHDDFEDFSVILKGDRGIASLVYTSRGSRNHPKERIEFFADGRILVNEDYRRVRAWPEKRSRSFTSKGFREEIEVFLASAKEGAFPIPVDELLLNCDLIFEVQRRLGNPRPVRIPE